MSGLAGVEWPGNIKENVSKFDNSTELTMEPAWVRDESKGIMDTTNAFKLGLFKSSKMQSDDVIMTVIIDGAHAFSQNTSLQINIDGEITSLVSIDTLTEFEHIGYINIESSKRYLVKKDLIKKMIDGKSVWIKISLLKTYLEGNFSTDNMTSARPAFKKFYFKVWEEKKVKNNE